MVNGSNVEEGKNNGAAIIPNLDSISEFRIITNNFDAEYGNYSGGQINVVTKSGTNQFHGSGFEFLRNTVLDAKNYYSLPTDKTPVFQQNQFGGHIRRTDQERQDFLLRRLSGHSPEPGANRRMRRCPRLANFAGNFSDSASSLTGVVNGPAFWASILSQPTRLYGYRPRTLLHAGLHQQCAIACFRMPSSPRTPGPLWP